MEPFGSGDLEKKKAIFLNVEKVPIGRCQCISHGVDLFLSLTITYVEIVIIIMLIVQRNLNRTIKLILMNQCIFRVGLKMASLLFISNKDD